jgi:uncharacterized membrane protein YphA (DoxX/SURF4 family)
VLGRVLYAAPFAVFGILHFMNAEVMARAVPVPGGPLWIYLTGAVMLCAAVAMITGVLARWGAYVIAALMAVFILLIHLPGLYMPEVRPVALANLLKDTSLLGAALGWAAYFGEHARFSEKTTWHTHTRRVEALR